MLSVRKYIVLVAMLTGVATPAIAKSDLEKQLAVMIGEDPGQATAGKAKGAPPRKSGWIHRELNGKAGRACSMVYRDGVNSMGYIGPSSDWKKSYFFVSGPNVPYTNNPHAIRVALVSDGDSDQIVKAFNYRVDKNNFAILFELTDFSAALDVMDDQENVAVVMRDETSARNKQSLFSGSWVGGHAAREKIRACLAAQK